MKKISIQTELLEARLLFAYPISIGSADYDSAFKVAATPDGGSVVAGVFKGTADFDPTSGQTLVRSVGDTAMYVARYSSTGALVWVKTFFSNEGEIQDSKRIDLTIDPELAGNSRFGVGIQPLNLGVYVTGLTVDASGNILFTAPFLGTVDFDPGRARVLLTVAGDDDFLNTALVKLNPNGGLTYARLIGGQFSTIANDVATDLAGNAYITGYFTRSADFDPTAGTAIRTTRGREDIFIASYTANGLLRWVTTTSDEDIALDRRSSGNALAVDGQGSVYVTGQFSAKTFFGAFGDRSTFIESNGETDTFLARLDANDGSFQWVRRIGGELYDGGVAIAIGPGADRIYVGSYFQDVMDADPGPTVRLVRATPEEIGKDPDFSDLLISRFNSAGEFVWAKPIGNGHWETLGGMAVDSTGGIVITGGFYGALDFDPGRGRAVLVSTLGVEDFDDINDGDRDFSYDAFVLRLSSSGRFEAAISIGAASDDFGADVAIGPGNRLFVAGQFRGTFVFPNSSSKLRPIGKQDSFVARFDASDLDLLA